MGRRAAIAAAALAIASLLLAASAQAALPPPPSQTVSGYVQVRAKVTDGIKEADNPTKPPSTVCLDYVLVHVEADGAIPLNQTRRYDFDERDDPDFASTRNLACVYAWDPWVANLIVDLVNTFASQEASASQPSSASSSAAGPRPLDPDASGTTEESYVFTLQFSFSDGCSPSAAVGANVVRASDGAQMAGDPFGASSPDVCELEKAAGLPAFSPAAARGLAWDTIRGMLPRAPAAPEPLPSPAAPARPEADPGAQTTTISNTLVARPHEADDAIEDEDGAHETQQPILSDRLEASGAVRAHEEAEIGVPSRASPSPSPAPAPATDRPGPTEEPVPARASHARAAAPRGTPLEPAHPDGSDSAQDATPDVRAATRPPVHPAGFGARAAQAAALTGIGAAALCVVAWATLLALRGRLAARADPLRHPVRRALYDALREQAGSSTTELARRLAVHHTTVRYHSFVLRRAGILIARDVEGRRRFFLAGTPQGSAAAVCRAALASGTARAVFDAVVQAPGLRPSEVAAAVGTSHENACYHVRRLARLGLVDARSEEGGARRVYPRV